MLWVRAFHIVFMVTWFAGLFYLPRLFVYHTRAQGEELKTTLATMERRLYWAITTPGGVLTVALGAWLLVAGWPGYATAGWMHAKLALVAVLVAFHVYCGRLVGVFARGENRRSERFYRWLNELPTVVLIAVVVLVEVQPF